MATSYTTAKALRDENKRLSGRVNELELSVGALKAEKEALERQLKASKQDFEVLKVKAEELMREKSSKFSGRQIINRAIERQKQALQLERDKHKSL